MEFKRPEQPRRVMRQARKCARKPTLPFPEGAIIAKLAWKPVLSVGDDTAPGHFQAFVPRVATTVEIMVKDSTHRHGRPGFSRFIGGKTVDEAQNQTCFFGHEAERARLCPNSLRATRRHGRFNA